MRTAYFPMLVPPYFCTSHLADGSAVLWCRFGGVGGKGESDWDESDEESGGDGVWDILHHYSLRKPCIYMITCRRDKLCNCVICKTQSFSTSGLSVLAGRRVTIISFIMIFFFAHERRRAHDMSPTHHALQCFHFVLMEFTLPSSSWHSDSHCSHWWN